MSIRTCQTKLEEFFPELKEGQAINMLQKLKSDRPEILATCRYDDCQKCHRNNR